MSTTNLTRAEMNSFREVNFALVVTNEEVDLWILDSSCFYYLCPLAD